LWILLLAFTLLLVGPFLVGRFVYEKTYNELKAGYDVATARWATSNRGSTIWKCLAARREACRAQRREHHPANRRLARRQGSGVIVDKAGFIITTFTSSMAPTKCKSASAIAA